MYKKALKSCCACILLLLFIVSAMACTRSEKWVDEALLHDGRTVEVHRKVAYHYGGGELSQMVKAGPDQYSIEVRHPDTSKTIKWSGERHVYPVLIDFVEGVPYLVVMPEEPFSNVKLYGCPEIPYVFLKYEQKTSKWIPVPRNLAPKVLQKANLSQRFEYYAMKDTRQTKESIKGRHDMFEHTTAGFFNEVIPQNYETWNYEYKLDFKNKRFKNDCRPTLPLEVEVMSPPPPRQKADVEILETIDYNPERIIQQDEWVSLRADKDREESSEYCKSLFIEANPNEPWQGMRFTRDVTRQKEPPYKINDFRRGVRYLCEKDYIIYYAYLELPVPDQMVITKYTVTGDMIYRIRFHHPEKLSGFIGSINESSVKLENGYLNFEWWYFRSMLNHKKNGIEWHVKRIIKARFREPDNRQKR
jgi:hypothetical protein